MNWYKTANMIGQIAQTLASLLVESYQGISQSSLDKSYRIVSAIPDEQSLQETIDRAIVLTQMTTKQDQLNPQQLEIIDIVQSSFYESQVPEEKIESKNINAPEEINYETEENTGIY